MSGVSTTSRKTILASAIQRYGGTPTGCKGCVYAITYLVGGANVVNEGIQVPFCTSNIAFMYRS